MLDTNTLARLANNEGLPNNKIDHGVEFRYMTAEERAELKINGNKYEKLLDKRTLGGKYPTYNQITGQRIEYITPSLNLVLIKFSIFIELNKVEKGITKKMTFDELNKPNNRDEVYLFDYYEVKDILEQKRLVRGDPMELDKKLKLEYKVYNLRTKQEMTVSKDNIYNIETISGQEAVDIAKECGIFKGIDSTPRKKSNLNN